MFGIETHEEWRELLQGVKNYRFAGSKTKNIYKGSTEEIWGKASNENER